MSHPTQDPPKPQEPADLWQKIREDADQDARKEPLLASFLYNTILNHETLERALAYHLANKLANANLQPISLMELFLQIMQQDPEIPKAVRADIIAVRHRDAACKSYSTPLLYFKGFHAIESYRMAHWLWVHGRIAMALALQSRISEAFGVDIHPAARMGRGCFIDHATAVVIGETAVIGNNVSMLHGVTLGGVGNETGDRHPKVGDGVLIGAGASLLGNIKIGEGAKIGASSVVLHDIPPHRTAVGVPAKVVGRPRCDNPGLEMNHTIDEDDPEYYV